MTTINLKVFLQVVLFGISLVIGLGNSINAQGQEYRIRNVKIEGLKNVDRSMVLTHCGLTKGARVTQPDIQKAIRNLWGLKLFADVQILYEKKEGEQLDLLLRLEEYPRLSEWHIEGNKKFKKKEIDKEIGFYKGMIFNAFKKYKSQKKLLKKYREAGYLLARVEVKTTEEDEQVTAEIVIKEGEKVQVKRIRVLGGKTLSARELKKAFKKIKEKRWWRGADFDREKYEEDLDNLMRFCHNKGLRDVEIIRDSIYYNEDKRHLFIDVHINEGRQYYFGNVAFEGMKVFSEAELRKQLLFEKGDVYSPEIFEKSVRQNIQNLYYNQGYLFAAIQPLEKPVEQDTVDIHIRIKEGHIVRIKEIFITGNTKTSEKVIRREFKIYPGSTFNRALLERSVRDVWVLNYFSNVVPDVKMLPDDDKQVNLEVKVEERSTDTANLTAGYGGRDGWVGNIGFSLNNFSLKHPLAGGDGQQLNFKWEFGKRVKNFSLSFVEPWTFGSTTLTGFSLFHTLRKRNDDVLIFWNRQSVGGLLQLGRRFRWPDNYFRGDWNFQVAENKFWNIKDGEEGRVRNSLQVSLTQVFQRDSRNRPQFPTRGSLYRLRTRLAGGPLQGDEDFLENTFSMEWYMPLRWGFVLFAQNKLGVISELKSGAYINPNEFFQMGGSGMNGGEQLRGYQFGSIGKNFQNSSAKGGRSMQRFTAEIRIPLVPNPTLFGLVFMEAGNLWETFGETNLSDLKRSVGFGGRLFMPLLGIIGVDFGYGLDNVDAANQRKGEWKVHFRFGQF